MSEEIINVCATAEVELTSKKRGAMDLVRSGLAFEFYWTIAA